MKNIKVDDKIWAKLMKLKIELRKKTVNEIIKKLMEKSK